MVKKLFLIRHARTNSPTSDLKDFDRELTREGLRDAVKLGSYFKSNLIVPDHFMSSTAVRARQTSEMIADQVGIDLTHIHFDQELYDASTRILGNMLSAIDDDKKITFLVAHNPAISYLAEYLSGESIGGLPPGGMVYLEQSADSWKELSQGTAFLNLKHYPEEE